MIKINSVLESIPPSGIRKFFEIVAEQPDVISLSVGEPDFNTPWHIREYAVHALETSNTHYSGNRGLPELLTAIANYSWRKFNVRYNSKKEILVTNGASEAFDLIVRALLNPNDEVLIPTPSYVMYTPLIQLAGGVPVSIATSRNWKPSLSELYKKITPRSRALILSYPNNPTGITFTRSELKKIATFADKNNLIVVSDEIYAELTYSDKHTAFASLPGMKSRTITISGVSKAWAMTGFRLGWMTGPAKLIDAATKIHQYAALCASSISQTAAIEALQEGDSEVEKMRTEYHLRRDFIVRELNRIGLKSARPSGAFYVFPNVYQKTGLSGEKFALNLLQQEKVAVVPGSAFGEKFSDFVRIGYATNLAALEEALIRIERFVKKCKK